MSVVSASLPDGLVQEMDTAIEAGGYKGRSAFLRAALRHFLQSQERTRPGHQHGSITIAYPHGKEARVSDVRHAFHDVVLSMMHTHCEPDLCMDVLLVGGPGPRVQELQDTLARMRDVHRSVLVPVHR